MLDKYLLLFFHWHVQALVRGQIQLFATIGTRTYKKDFGTQLDVGQVTIFRITVRIY